MFVNKYSSSYGAFGLGIALYGHVSQPSNSSVVLLAKISYVLECKPQYSGCVNRWVIFFTSPELMNYIVEVLRVSCSLSYELRRVAIELILEFFTLSLIAEIYCKAFSMRNGHFWGETLTILPR